MLAYSKLLSLYIRDTTTLVISSEVTGVIIPSVISTIGRLSITHECVSDNTHVWANQMVMGSINFDSPNCIEIFHTIPLF